MSSPSFLVVTDLPPSEAESTARDLEQSVEALTAVAFAHSRARTTRTTVIVFRNTSEFHAFFPRMLGGVAMSRLPNDLEGAPFVVIPERIDSATRVRFIHELTHDLFARNFGWAPPWLNEGWAEYYSTLRVEDGRAHLGEALPQLTFTTEGDFFASKADTGEWVRAVPVRAVPRASDLFTMDRSAFYGAMRRDELDARQEVTARYAGSWALVHMLLDGGEPYTPRFRAFLERVRTGEVLSRAWERAFADIPRERFDRDLHDYLVQGKLAVWESPLPSSKSELEIRRRPLAASDAHLLWARLTRWGGNDDVAAKRDLDEALADAPHAAEPHYWLGVYAMSHGDMATAERELDAAVRITPRDPRYRLGMLRLLSSSPSSPEDEITDATDRLGEVAETAGQLRSVADVERRLRRPNDALAFAKRAYDLAPIDPLVLNTYAAVLYDLSRFQEAATIQRMAVSFLPDDASLPEFAKRLRTYEARALEDTVRPDERPP